MKTWLGKKMFQETKIPSDNYRFIVATKEVYQKEKMLNALHFPTNRLPLPVLVSNSQTLPRHDKRDLYLLFYDQKNKGCQLFPLSILVGLATLATQLCALRDLFIWNRGAQLSPRPYSKNYFWLRSRQLFNILLHSRLGLRLYPQQQ